MWRRTLRLRAPRLPADGLTLAHFVGRASGGGAVATPQPSAAPVAGRSFFVETYGCQMNANDSDIVRAVLVEAGLREAPRVDDADVILVNTCAIRENAEAKVWQRLGVYKKLKAEAARGGRAPLVGVLGCMAERLKTRLLESDKAVDVVAGPDAYRDLPRLLAEAGSGHEVVNVLLSLDETYADVAPVRTGANRVSAYVSVMRGCDNMCSYCIVPFTRGRERSRPADSVVAEVRALAEQGFREVVLLGQNVNSYNFIPPDVRAPLADTFDAQSRGFRNISRRRESEAAVRFAELVDLVASVSAEMRVRFTSPHPKDFADELLHVIRDRPNVCKQVHLPAQSGSSAVLARMRRGYTREAYLDLVRHVRATVPGVALSSDFIAGFCGETEEEHAETLSLIREVGYDHAFMFAYSQREKTHAHRTYADDVPEDVKGRRLRQVIDTFQEVARTRTALEVGKTHLVLVEGRSRKSERDLSGRTDGNRTVNFARAPVKGTRDAREAEPAVGEYVEVKITGATSVSLQGVALRRTTLQAWSEGGREM